MGHAEITETPRKPGKNILPRGGEGVERKALAARNRLHGTNLDFRAGNHHNRHGEHSDKHQNALEKVCPANRLKAAREGIDDDNCRKN